MLAVIGQTPARRPFGHRIPLGQVLRIADRCLRVIGPLAEDGVSLDDKRAGLALVPVISTQALFGNPSVCRIRVETTGRDALDPAAADIRTIIEARDRACGPVTPSYEWRRHPGRFDPGGAASSGSGSPAARGDPRRLGAGSNGYWVVIHGSGAERVCLMGRARPPPGSGMDGPVEALQRTET